MHSGFGIRDWDFRLKAEATIWQLTEFACYPAPSAPDYGASSSTVGYQIHLIKERLM